MATGSAIEASKDVFEEQLHKMVRKYKSDFLI